MPPPPTSPKIPEDDSTTQRKVRKLQRRFENEDARHRAAGMALLLSDYSGRRFLWFLLEEAKVFVTPFDADAAITAFRTGRQSFGQELLAEIIAIDPASFTRMIQENQDVQRERQHNVDHALNLDGDADAGSGADE